MYSRKSLFVLETEHPPSFGGAHASLRDVAPNAGVPTAAAASCSPTTACKTNPNRLPSSFHDTTAVSILPRPISPGRTASPFGREASPVAELGIWTTAEAQPGAESE